MTTQIELLWDAISRDANASPLNESDCRLVKVGTASSFDTFAGIDGAGCVIVAFSINSRPPMIDFETGAIDYFRQQRLNGCWLMALRLKSDGLRQVFGRLSQDLVDESARVMTETALIALFKDRLTLWKRLFGQNGDGLLKPYQIKGLLGELLALESFVSKTHATLQSIVTSWTGPDGGDQDFLFNDRAVEIKSVSPFVDEVTISSAEQLDCLLPLELRLYTLRESSIDENDSISLTKQVAQIEHILQSVPEALKIFRQKLLAVGYVENPYYDAIRFSILDIKRYLVSDSFPRVVRTMLTSGVTNLSYGISLSAIASHQIKEALSASR